VTLAALAEAIG